MTHQCHWNEVENIFLPREATIVQAAQATPTEKHFTLRMADGQPMEFEPGQILELGLFGYGEIPIGFASSPTRKHTFDLVVRTVGRVSDGGQQAGRRRLAVRARPARPRLRPRQAARPRRARRRRRHRPVPDAEPHPVHPRPARRVQALRALLRRARARLQLFLDDLACWRGMQEMRVPRDRRPRRPDLDGQRRRHHHALPQGHSCRPETRVVICGPPDLVPVRDPRARRDSASRARTSSSTSSAA